MRKQILGLAAVLMALGLSGCASSWKQANHDRLDEGMLKKALNDCEFEKQRKLSHLYYASSHGDDAAANKRMEEKGKEIYQDALLCMKKKGFTK